MPARAEMGDLDHIALLNLMGFLLPTYILRGVDTSNLTP
jgi:hypothetical protein